MERTDSRRSPKLAQLVLRSSGSRAQALYERLREGILSGELHPGERLIELEVANAANLSRTPVREALQRLEADGLVREGNGGLEVNEISREELSERCAVREILEGMATELAAGAANPLELATIQGILEREVQAVENNEPAEVHVELNREFHDAIWRASHNRYLSALLAELRERLGQLQGTTLRDEKRRTAALDEHKAIVDGLTRHDRVAAGEAARSHFRNAMALRLQMPRVPQ